MSIKAGSSSLPKLLKSGKIGNENLEEVIRMIYLSEKIYRKFEKGIVPLLKALHQIDLPTYDSCYGHLKPLDKNSFPNVYINGSSSIFEPNALLKLINLLVVWNQQKERKWQWLIVDVFFNDGQGPSQLFWLRPFEQNANRSSRVLSRLRQDATDLAEFIQQVSREPT